MTTWTQDNTSVSYQLNPRVTETNVYDPAGNRARTEITYQQFTFANGTSCQLPRDLYEYAANATTKLRSTRTDYNTSTTYTDRRIIGLVSEKRLYEGDVTGPLMSKVVFNYDESGSIQGSDAPVQHDNINYTVSFVAGRANLSSVKSFDVTNTSVFRITSSKYSTAGAVVSSRDSLNHEMLISYADSFSDNNNSRNTFAYPTTVTDPDGYSSTSKYHFDFGAVTYTRTPQPNVATNTPGPERVFAFDTIGRPLQITNLVSNAYTRFEYSISQLRIDTFATIQDGQGEARSFKITDGHGRVIAGASDHPGSVGGYSGQKIVYDVMGRVIRTSNPTETNASGTPASWTTAGDDATAGWIYTEQTYDWKGRPLVTTNQDGTTETASYTGCGCAGGEVVTLTDEGTIAIGVAKKRQQKIYSDVLGRTVKTEIRNWNGTSLFGTGDDSTVYSATVNIYNARNQISQVRQYAGAEGSATYQDTIMTYDGYGRLKTKHVPEEDIGTKTTWTYNADDTIDTVTDARGAVTTLGYAGSNRGLVKTATHMLPGSPTINVSYNYDAVGNRTSMTDPSGTVIYEYNQLSQLISEARMFAGVNGSYALNYSYNLAGELTSLSIPFTSQQIGYTYDNAARLNGVTASGFSASFYNSQTQQTQTQTLTSFASNTLYRAWGGRKSMTYGNSVSEVITYNSRMQASGYFLNNLNYSPNPPTVVTSMEWTYDYFNDGRLNFSHHSTENKWDRSFAYDHVGRLSEAKTNRLARGQSWDFWNPDPYEQTITYDAFNHSSRSGRLYRGNPSDSGSYSNNRRVGAGWTYDAAGNVTFDQSYTHEFDAAGKNTFATSTAMAGDGSQQFPSEPVTELTSTYDADGLSTKRFQVTRQNIHDQLTEGNPLVQVLTDYQTSYYLRSSVLGGQTVAEFSPDGSGGLLKRFVYIYAGGERIAKETNDSVNFEHHNPGSDGWIVTNGNSSHRGAWREERDPFGAELPMSDPFASEFSYPLQKWSEPLFLEGGDPFDYRGGMTIDGMPVSVAEFNRRMRNGSAGAELSVGGIPRVFVTNQQQLSHITVDVFDVDDELRGLPQSQRWGGTYYRGSFELDVEVRRSSSYRRPPQNAQFDIPNITRLVNQTLSNPNCLTFYQRILTAANKNNAPLDNGNMKDIFKRFLDQKKGGLTRKKPANNAGWGGITGHLPDGNAEIFSPDFGPDQRNFLDAQATLAELMHHAGSKAWYSDYELAVAANRIPEYAKLFRQSAETNVFDDKYKQMKDGKVIGIGPPKNKNDGGYSSYIHNIERAICPVGK